MGGSQWGRGGEIGGDGEGVGEGGGGGAEFYYHAMKQILYVPCRRHDDVYVAI